MKKILYIGWVGFGNHGDDFCQHLFEKSITAKAQARGVEVDIKALFPSNFDEYTLARLAPDLVVLGAGSLFEPVYLKPLVLAQQSAIPTIIWGSGYDSMLPTPIDASRISPDSAYMIRQVVQNAQKIGVRGPYTVEMLGAIGAEHPDLHISGDPGLLLSTQKSEASPADQVGFQQPLLAVNWGTAANRVLGGSEGQVAQELASVLSELANDFTIVIYPVWKRDVIACHKLYSMLNNRNNVYYLKRVPTMDELIDLYKRSVLTINMKLHANVFSAALNVPFVCLAYRMKGYDFGKSLGWEQFTILFSDQELKIKLKQAVEELSSNISEYKAQLAQKTEEHTMRLSELGDEIIELLT